jgi:hypothetical protein
MNLAELKEQVFELIDREVVDPEGVNEMLAALPGGREYFDQIKTALGLADLLPIEEPSAGLDAKILASACE